MNKSKIRIIYRTNSYETRTVSDEPYVWQLFYYNNIRELIKFINSSNTNYQLYIKYR